MPRILVSNGYGQFHMARLAEKLAAKGKLSGIITGAYPTAKLQKLACRFTEIASIKRFLERGISVPGVPVNSSWIGEISHQIAQKAKYRNVKVLYHLATIGALETYRWKATKIVEKSSADVYHYRAGMGGRSVEVAKSKGMITVCDHSIAHPRLLQGLIDASGEVSNQLDALWTRVLEDIEQADRLLVNSDFVSDTCIKMGIPSQNIFVAYTAVDPLFINAIDDIGTDDSRWFKPQVLFAGALERRKGADVLVAAAGQMSNSSLAWKILGDWEPNARHLASRLPTTVRHSGKVPRFELARTLAESAIFLFPTRAEGSARVVAEALAAGCYVITTPNAGSVVRDGIDGRIVPVGDVEGVVMALREYEGMPVPERIERSSATKRYARVRLSEEKYASSVSLAYAPN